MLPIILLLPIITVTIAANDKLPRIRNRRAERGFGIGSIYFVGGPMELPPSESRRGLGVIPGLKNSGQAKIDRTTATAGRGGDGSGQGGFKANRRKETNLIRPPPSPPLSPPSPPPSPQSRPPSPPPSPPSPPPSPSPPSPPPPLAPPPQNQDAFKLKPTPINMMAAPVELDSTMIDSGIGNKPQLSAANNVASSQLAIQQEMLAVLKSIKTILEEIRNDARTDAKNDDDNDNGGGSKEVEFKSK